MAYSRSARSLRTCAAAAGVLLAAGCSGSSHHGKTPGVASPGASVPATAGSTSGTHTPGKSIGPTTASSSPTTAPYSTPGKEPDANSNQAAVLKSLPGSAAATCAVVGTHSDLRSGSVAVGNFVVARKKYSDEVATTEVPEVFLYVIPQDAKSMRSVTVTVDPTGTGPTRQVTSKSVEQADAWTYFAVNIPVYAPGSYRLTMVSGANKGCFDVSFAK